MQDYTAILIERGWVARTAPQTPPAPLRAPTEKVAAQSPGEMETEMAESEKRFGQAHARLFPLIGKRVWTPKGAGKLLSVFAARCKVWPDGAERTIRVLPEDVRVIQ